MRWFACLLSTALALDATTSPAPTTTAMPRRPGYCTATGRECKSFGTGSDYVCVAVESNVPELFGLAQCVKQVDDRGSNICVGDQAGICPTFGSWPSTYRVAQPICAFVNVPQCNQRTTTASPSRLLQANTTKGTSLKCFTSNFQLANGSTTTIRGIYKCVDSTVYRQKSLGFDLTNKQLQACAGNGTSNFNAALCNGHGTCSPKSQFSSEYECRCNTGYDKKDNCFLPVGNVCDALGQCGALGQCDSKTGECICKPGSKGAQCSECDPAAQTSTVCSGHGTCGIDGKCVCTAGHGGAQCEVFSFRTPAPSTSPVLATPSSDSTAATVVTAASVLMAIHALSY
ncbi:hypothetical protein LEN26_010507 [Aphanomyces euteiches]|nr:hypothetical protein AeMF1_010909 [Aphanomyces euteiches]KAH9121819.1 hypothetical protein LEN26_010507 [Aphanomyces euteiches]